MAAEAGRTLRIKYDADGAGGSAATVIAGARTDALTINNEMIDITDKDDAGVRTLLDAVAVKSLSATCTGLMKDNTLANLAANSATGSTLHYFEITVGTLATYASEFMISTFEITGETDDGIEFSMSLESSGAVTVS